MLIGAACAMLPLLLLLCLFSLAESELQFLHNGYNATIQENSRPRTYLGSRRLMGVPLGSLPPSSQIRFHIRDGDSDGFFTTETEEIGGVAVLQIRTKTGLRDVVNRERTSQYDLTVVGEIRNHHKSHSSSVSTAIQVNVLDINDNIPLFYEDSYRVTVNEDLSVHSSIIEVSADDADTGSNGKVYYSLEDPTINLFSVHPTSGIISLSRPLDYTLANSYQLVVIAEDRGVKPSSYRRSSSAQTVVHINVQQVNLHSPKLSVNQLPHVVEHAYTYIYAIISVTDRDVGNNGDIKSVNIIQGDSNRLFNIVKGTNPSEYNLVVLKLLDREIAPTGYNLTIRAIDSGFPPKSGSAYVHINIADINDQIPVFLKEQYEEAVSEEAPPNTAVVRVSALDLDQGNNGKVLFRILAGNKDKKFWINSITGLISTNDWLDAETTGYYSLAVAAIDQASNAQRKQSSAKVIIRVLDSNDNAPQFSTPNTEVSIDESLPTGSYVTRVLASDEDSGENGFISYGIANLDQVPFTIDPFDGTIRTSSILDFEAERRVYTIKVRASDWGQPLKRETETTVKVKVQPTNDNRPVFVGSVCSGWLDLDAPIGSTITRVRAIDLDDGDKVFYRLEEGDLRDCWTLDSTSGTLSLSCKLRERYSQVKKKTLVINITATDGRHISDKAILSLAVIDKEKEVVELNKNNARVACEETDILKEEIHNQALARQNNDAEENFALFPLRYGYNTHAPEFPPNFPEAIDVLEDMALGSEILKVGARDHDRGHNGRIVYSISSGDIDSVFMIDTNTGIITLWAPLDREKTNQYNLNISVYDLGVPHKHSSKNVTINIMDVNDNAPEFTQLSYSLHLPENMRNGTSVAHIMARDQDLGLNGKVTYELVSKFKDFTLDPISGVLYVTGVLNREEIDEYDLRIRAMDNAVENRKFAMTRVYVTVLDINDCIPNFGESRLIKVSIPEDIPQGAVIATFQAFDEDLGPGGIVLYSIVSGAKNDFRIDSKTGSVRVASKLDYRERQLYNVTIKAQDEGSPSLSSTATLLVQIINVDTNSSPPRLPTRVSKANVLENQPAGTLVTTLKAFDPDGGNIYYDIVGGTGHGIFSITKKGEIRTLRTLDRETVKGYWLTITVSDGGTVPQTDTCHIYIEVDDMNDHVPQSESPVYRPTVSEDAPVGATVVILKATDGDLSPSNITFFISRSRRRRNGWMLNHPEGEEDALEVFDIDKLNGVVTTTAPLDRERQSEYDLWVGITDGTLTSLTPVFVSISDVNDNDPEFLENIYRFNMPAVKKHLKNQPLFRVFARDKDVGRNADIRYSVKDKGRFKIDEKTGTIYATKSLPAGNTFEITVKATDNGNPQRSSISHVIVRLLDAPKKSKNPPVMDVPLTAHVMETDEVGHVVTFIVAFDQDNDTLYYYIEDGNDEDRFSIGLDSGLISLAKELDRETRDLYVLTVAVSDGVHITRAKVNVEVLDFNDHRPIFGDLLYRSSVSEETKVGSTLLKLTCQDRDSLSSPVVSSSFAHPSSSLFFSLHHTESVGSRDLFTLDPTTGKLLLAHPLNRELHTSHMLTVSCQDRGGIQREDLSRVIITVDDSNDHVPKFLESMIEAQISEGAAKGSIVIRVTAIDADEGENGRLSYSIVEGNQGAAFTIDEELGYIRVSDSLSPNPLSEYLLLVRAIDHAQASKSASVPVRITVKSSVDSPPTWIGTGLPKVIELSEWTPLNKVVALVAAASPSNLHYEITNGNSDEESFVITPSSGILTLKIPLDYETISWFNLTITATNSAGISRSTWLSVRILDENDWWPEWELAEYEGLVLDSAKVGSPVLRDPFSKYPEPLTVRAVDKDTAKNGRVTYTLLDKNAAKLFSVNEYTGSIRVAGQLDEMSGEVLKVHVWARDSGDPSRECLAPATVNVKIRRTSYPQLSFESVKYQSQLFLPAVPGVKVTCVKASTEIKKTQNVSRIKRSLSKNPMFYKIMAGNIDKHFRMDSSDGCIYVLNHVDLSSFYNLTITASSGGLKSHGSLSVKKQANFHKAVTSLLISVQQLPAGSLKFTKAKYWANVIENSTKELNLLVLGAKGLSLGHHVEYSLLNGKDFFEVRSSVGVLKTTGRPFDRENKDHFLLIVEARDMEQPDVFGLVTVHVAVLDVNDNEPVFVGLPYDVLVPTSAQRGHVVTKVRAIDADKGAFGEVRYELVRGSGELFSVNKKTGDIILKQPLTPPDKAFSLTIAAYDGGKQPLSSQAHVIVRVVSAEGPLFDQSIIRVEVPENKPLMSAVTRIEAQSPSDNDIIYSIMAGDSDALFDLDFKTGINGGKSQSVLRLAAPLDYESKSSHNLTIRGRDPLTGLHSDCQVLISVTDVNDNEPRFQKLTFHGEVSEAAHAGYTVLKLQAYDHDTGLGGTIRYECETDCKNFTVDLHSGHILLTGLLDAERATEHKFNVIAKDLGQPSYSSKASVVIKVLDLNDNAPIWNQGTYHCRVSTEAKAGHVITSLSAKDPDISNLDGSHLVYHIVAGDPDSLFHLDPNSGLLSVTAPQKLSGGSTVGLNISASDGVHVAFTSLRINVLSSNINSPKFVKAAYEAKVEENAPPGQLVLSVGVVDADGDPYGESSFQIFNQEKHKVFSIDHEGKIYTEMSLDRESKALYEITVSAIDGGGLSDFTTVRIYVLDRNDNAPVFAIHQYQANIPVDAHPETTVLEVTAEDADEDENSGVVYSLYEDNNAEAVRLFSIQPITGKLILNEQILGRENEVFQFFIRATDKGDVPLHSDVPVTIFLINAHERAPFCPVKYAQFFLQEDAEIGSLVTSLWKNGPMETKYSILRSDQMLDGSPDMPDPFGLSPSGAIFVQDLLNHEQKRVHKITVLNETLTTPPLVDYMTISIVVMDVNDCAPEFSSTSYAVTVAENSPQGAIIAKITATDKDDGNNGQIQYLIKNTTDDWVKSIVSIDPHTGSVRLLTQVDREENATFSFTVLAIDSGANRLSAETDVLVTIQDYNDNPPVFTKDVYITNVLEDTEIGTVIVELSIEDDDFELSTLDYFVLTGDDGGRFLVQDSGQVYVARPLDREHNDHYSLIVTATDGKFSANATVFITVIDVNDNGPKCQERSYHRVVPEDVTVGSHIVSVSVYDPDEGFNAKSRFVLSGEGFKDFTVDQQSGKIVTSKRLDRETQESYKIIVTVEDWQEPEWKCESIVTVSVTDVNDNSPSFPEESSSVSISEGAPVFGVLTKMVASDADLGINRLVQYSLADSGEVPFVIDSNEGIISLAKVLDRERTDVYKVVVIAQDSGTPSFSSSTILTVTVTDINDNPPEFVRTLQQVTVAENTAIGSDISRVMATSKDIGINADISYHIEHTTEKEYLRIHSKTGVISINSVLDYEDVQLVVATVIARDGGIPPLSSTALLNVTITDVNDNSPVFSQAAYEVSVIENQMPGRSLHQVSASDADCGKNGEISFSISAGNKEGRFAIDQNSGNLILNRQIDREQVPYYEIEITGQDNGSPSKSSTTVIKVNVMDVNDNPPKFSQKNYSVVVQENRGAGYAVHRFIVTDDDSESNGRPFTWELLGYSPLNRSPLSKTFVLDQDGTLRLASNKLNHRVKNFYQVAIRVWDSGTPPLSSDTKIDIKIVEESRYPPTIFPLHATIVSYLKPYPGGVVGKVTALDQDPYDTLDYSILPFIKGQNYFEIDEQDGNLVALTPLDSGRYKVNISVSDGKFERNAEAAVDVFVISDDMVDHSVIVHIGDMEPEEFLSRYRKIFLTTVAYEIGAKKDKVKILSIQPSILHSVKNREERSVRPTLDVLLVAIKRRGGYMSRSDFTELLKTKSNKIKATLSLSLFSVMNSICDRNKNCSNNGHCIDFINVNDERSVPLNTQSSSLVTPRFYQEPTCVCDQGFDGLDCENLVNACGRKPCAKYETCTPSDTLSRGYSCHCRKGMAGPKCNIDLSKCKRPSCHYPVQPLSFKGKSYAQYSMRGPLESTSMHLSSYIRTRSPSGVVFYASGDVDYSILEISEGYVQYRWDCGSGEGLVRVLQVRVDDNEWHSINLTRQGTVSQLIVDGRVISGEAPGVHDVLNLESGNIFLGAKVETYIEPYKSVQSLVEFGFVGCVDLVTLNGIDLPVAVDTPISGKIRLKRLANVELQCPQTLPPPGICSSHSCLNGGTCTEFDQTYSCTCPSRFTGKHCETDTAPCASSPCLNGGECTEIGHLYICSCPLKLSGKRCEYGVFCNPNPCQNGGRCEEGSEGPICKCQHFIGAKCEMDIDECTRSPCQNGGTCVNLYGGFQCVCTANVTGEYCTKIPSSGERNSNYFMSFKELVYLLAIVLACVIVVVIIVAWQRKKWKCKRHQQNNRVKLTGHHVKNDLKANDVPKRNSKICNVEADQLQQGPLLPRPSSYTPSGTADSVLLHTLKQLADLSTSEQEAYELNTLSRRRSNEYLHNLVGPTVASSPSANDSRNTRKPWDHHNNLNDSYFTPSKEVSFDLPPNLDEHPRGGSPCLNTSFSDNSNAGLPPMSPLSCRRSRPPLSPRLASRSPARRPIPVSIPIRPFAYSRSPSLSPVIGKKSLNIASANLSEGFIDKKKCPNMSILKDYSRSVLLTNSWNSKPGENSSCPKSRSADDALPYPSPPIPSKSNHRYCALIGTAQGTPVLKTLNESLDHPKQRGYQWDDYDIRGSTAMLTFSAPANAKSGSKGAKLPSYEKASEIDPLLDSSSDVSSITVVAQSSTPLLSARGRSTSSDNPKDTSYSFDEVLQVNNISVGSSDDADSENERNEVQTPSSVIEFSQDTIKYNIVSEEEEKISNIPSPTKVMTSPEEKKDSNTLTNNSIPLHSKNSSSGVKKSMNGVPKKNTIDRFGSPRSRRPYIRSDFGRVSDVSFISSLDDDEEYETLTEKDSKKNSGKEECVSQEHYL